ncbi:MAG: acyl-CoA dehydrogenase family protein, partial [Alphaproteobacteria bacterium]
MNLEDPFALPQDSPFYGSEHRQFQAAVRRFVDREIIPFINDWEEAGRIPRALHEKAAEAGLLGLGYPEKLGGTPADSFFSL